MASAPLSFEAPFLDSDGVYIIRPIEQSGQDELFKLPLPLIYELTAVVMRRRNEIDRALQDRQEVDGKLNLEQPEVLKLFAEDCSLSYLLLAVDATVAFRPDYESVYQHKYEWVKTLHKRRRMVTSYYTRLARSKREAAAEEVAKNQRKGKKR